MRLFSGFDLKAVATYWSIDRPRPTAFDSLAQGAGLTNWQCSLGGDTPGRGDRTLMLIQVTILDQPVAFCAEPIAMLWSRGTVLAVAHGVCISDGHVLRYLFQFFQHFTEKTHSKCMQPVSR